MSKGNQRIQYNKDDARIVYQIGYNDALRNSHHIRWKRDPYLYEYQLGYTDGTKYLKSLNKESKKFRFNSWIKSILFR